MPLNPREQRIMAAIGAVAAIYFFGFNSVYLFLIAGVIYYILRNRT